MTNTNTNGRVQGKAALVTGGGGGIGAACALALAREGAAVAVADIDLTAAQRTVADIEAKGGRAIALHVDMGDEASVATMVEAAAQALGGLDILHNNAADTRLSGTRDMPVERVDTSVWDDILRINLRGTLVACRAAIPHLRRRGGGAIINTSSNAALAGAQSHSAYSASKAAINSLTQSIATQHGKEGIRCNAVSPGLIVTAATQDKYVTSGVGDIMLRHMLSPRLGRPEDIAAAVVFLASDESAFITGQVICVDGGSLAHQPYVTDLVEHLAKK
ncbi:MAG TPA: glucose 1-dehydrogenase [Ramlibacter sp.]|nr:glucose 1-dehydrogenase [Ramlibacter sp.]